MALRRVRTLLGLSREEAEQLADRARMQVGASGYRLRTAAFVLATVPLLRLAIPLRLRQRAIGAYLHALLPGAWENLLYVAPDWLRAERRGRG